MCGDLCRDVYGDMWERMPGNQKPCQASIKMLVYQAGLCEAGWDIALAWLNQMQLFGSFNCFLAIIDIEFTVDTLGMRADSAQGYHEFTGNLRPGKFAFE